MNVSCPCCGIRYRHHAVGSVVSVRAHCSGCDTRFPVVPGRRPYRVLPALLAADPEPAPAAEPPLEPLVEIHSVPAEEPEAVALPEERDRELESPAQPEEAAPPPRRGPRAWLAVPLTLFLAAAGAGSGYYLSLLREAQILPWAAGGGAIGLLVGGALIRWTVRKA